LGGLPLQAQWGLPQVLAAVEMLPGNNGVAISKMIVLAFCACILMYIYIRIGSCKRNLYPCATNFRAPCHWWIISSRA
jgi:hypothetical protein